MLASLPLLTSFAALLTPLRGCFPRQATYENFVAVMFGWVMAQGTGTLSSALVAADLTGSKHWSAFYRLFSRGTWCIDTLGLTVAELLVARFVPDGTIVVAVDDTLHAKGGKNVVGAGTHHDPLTSTRTRAQFQFAHCWVTLALVVTLPFARHPRALPFLFRLNIPKKMADKWEVQHAKKTALAGDLVKILAARFPARAIRVVNDNLYSCDTLLKRLPPNVNMVGRPTPKQEAEADTPWQEHRVHIYGRDVTVRVKTWTAYWAPADQTASFAASSYGVRTGSTPTRRSSAPTLRCRSRRSCRSTRSGGASRSAFTRRRRASGSTTHSVGAVPPSSGPRQRACSSTASSCSGTPTTATPVPRRPGPAAPGTPGRRHPRSRT